MCRDGFLWKDGECLPCPAGYHLDSASNKCEPCSSGTVAIRERLLNGFASFSAGLPSSWTSQCQGDCHPNRFDDFAPSTPHAFHISAFILLFPFVDSLNQKTSSVDSINRCHHEHLFFLGVLLPSFFMEKSVSATGGWYTSPMMVGFIWTLVLGMVAMPASS